MKKLILSLALVSSSIFSAFADTGEFKVLVDTQFSREYLRQADEDFDGETENRSIYFFDTDEHILFDRGIIVRLRIRGDKTDLTVKLRPFSWSSAPAEIQEIADVECEWDVNPSTSSYSCSIKEEVDEREARDVARGRKNVWSLFTSAQKELFRTYYGAKFPKDDIRRYGPISSTRIQWDHPEFGELVLEHWDLRHQAQVCELSFKIENYDVSREAYYRARLNDWLRQQGWRISQDQTNKTPLVFEVYE